MRTFKLLTVVYLLVTAFGVVLWRVGTHAQTPTRYIEPIHVTTGASAQTPQDWFDSVRPQCNALEVATAMNNSPPPVSRDGQSYAATCLAMADRIDEARTVLYALSPEDQQREASLMFGAIHVEADAGREAEVSTAMELVLELQPANVMALYHAGSAAYSEARPEAAGFPPCPAVASRPIGHGWWG